MGVDAVVLQRRADPQDVDASVRAAP